MEAGRLQTPPCCCLLSLIPEEVHRGSMFNIKSLKSHKSLKSEWTSCLCVCSAACVRSPLWLFCRPLGVVVLRSPSPPAADFVIRVTFPPACTLEHAEALPADSHVGIATKAWTCVSQCASRSIYFNHCPAEESGLYSADWPADIIFKQNLIIFSWIHPSLSLWRVFCLQILKEEYSHPYGRQLGQRSVAKYSLCRVHRLLFWIHDMKWKRPFPHEDGLVSKCMLAPGQ